MKYGIRDYHFFDIRANQDFSSGIGITAHTKCLRSGILIKRKLGIRDQIFGLKNGITSKNYTISRDPSCSCNGGTNVCRDLQ